MEPADHEMYRAAIHGDLEAFELVIRKMSRPLFAIAFGALQNRDEADDVVQDAFVKAWKARWQVRRTTGKQRGSKRHLASAHRM